MTIHVVDAVILAAIWVWALSGYMMRSARTVAALLLFMVAYLLVPETPVAIAVGARGVLVAAAATAILVYPRAFLALPAAERRFDVVVSQTIQDASAAAGRALHGDMHTRELLATLERLESRLEALVPPSVAWQALNDRLVAFLRRHRELLTQVADARIPPEEELDAQQLEAKALVAAHHAVRRRARTFWG